MCHTESYLIDPPQCCIPSQIHNLTPNFSSCSKRTTSFACANAVSQGDWNIIEVTAPLSSQLNRSRPAHGFGGSWWFKNPSTFFSNPWAIFTWPMDIKLTSKHDSWGTRVYFWQFFVVANFSIKQQSWFYRFASWFLQTLVLLIQWSQSSNICGRSLQRVYS